MFPHTLFMNTEMYISYHFHIMKDDSPFGIFPITFKYKNHFQLLSCKKNQAVVGWIGPRAVVCRPLDGRVTEAGRTVVTRLRPWEESQRGRMPGKCRGRLCKSKVQHLIKCGRWERWGGGEVLGSSGSLQCDS